MAGKRKAVSKKPHAEKTKAHEERLIEIRFALGQIEEIFNPANYAADTPLVGHDESDGVKAFLHTIRWKEGSRGALLATLMREAIEDVNGVELRPAPLQELTRVLQERVPDVIDFTVQKKKEPASKPAA